MRVKEFGESMLVVWIFKILLLKERNNKGSEQAQLTNVQNQIWLDPTTYRNQNQAKNFLKLKILGWD